MVNNRAIVIVAIILILISVFAFGYYLTNDKTGSNNRDNIITGNVVYEPVEPTVTEPIKSESLILNS